jgi:hypothetical protein
LSPSSLLIFDCANFSIIEPACQIAREISKPSAQGNTIAPRMCEFLGIGKLGKSAGCGRMFKVSGNSSET